MTKINFKILLALVLFFFQFQFVSGQIIINEFCASNASIIEDTKYYDYSDWIELYNTSDESINIDGYYISDKPGNPDKYRISHNGTIQPKGYVLIWADGQNEGLHTNFKISADGEAIAIYSPDLELIDSVTFGYQKADITMGRNSEKPDEWGYFTKPTPMARNSAEIFSGFVNNVTEFSQRGGMYSSVVNVELFTDLGGEIHYSTNGAEPGWDSPKYFNSLWFNETTILRARVFKDGLIPGPVITHSYFINENAVNAKLPVVSLATDSDNFWDAEIGIFAQDDFKPLWEIPINIELFENNGSDRAAFNLTAGTKVNGLWSWQLPQKMLGVYFKKQYGNNKLEYPLFTQRKRSSYKNFALRASGSDWSYTLMRDVIAHNATLYNMDIDIMSYKPVSMFLNGEFLGIANMREKVNDDYIEKSYDIDGGTFDLIENEDFAEAGDLNAYNTFHSLLHNDLSIQSNFNKVAQLMDVENFTDYVITEMAFANTSISHNVMAWKPKEGGKWRWVLMDLDRGFFHINNHLIDFYLNQDEWPLENLFDNDEYLEYFAKRLAAQLYTSFNSERMIALIDEHKALVEDEIPRHIERWLGTTSSYGNAMPSVDYWYSEVDDLKSFVKARPLVLLSDLQNYGFGETVNLSLGTMPGNGGQIYLDDLKVPQGITSGYYLKNIDFTLKVKPTAGFNFVGWSTYAEQKIIESGSVWKYLDNGSNQGVGWISNSFDDSVWKSGASELGYGDGDENTIIDYGGDSDNKYITTYFRKTFSLTAEQLNSDEFLIGFVRDDGAIVYVNGIEVARNNLPSGNVTYNTYASDFIKVDQESLFIPVKVARDLFVEGENVIAVEVHQGSANSADVSFDLEMSALYTNSDIISTQTELNLNLLTDEHLIAVFEHNTQCVVPEVISESMTLNADCSPYIVQGDVIVNAGATLTIEPGVEIWMPEKACFWVNGSMIAEGNANQQITFKINPDYGDASWGIIGFKNTADTSYLKNVIIEDASMGPDPVFDIAAISAFKTNLILDSITLLSNYGNPIVARYSSVKLTNSTLHSDITGDFINVKYGKAYIANCFFEGNDQPDTDAIDYDEITNGVIKSCEIKHFHGFNSDAVDIGEKASGILIDSLWVYSITDKGLSVGQRSSVTIKNSVFVNCNLGIAVKDSSHTKVDRSIFYSNQKAVAAFEKNIGRAGGNVEITNSILSNSCDESILEDAESNLTARFNLSDTDYLGSENNNINGNPQFIDPNRYNFSLQSNSPALKAGMGEKGAIDIGTKHPNFYWEQSPMFIQLFVNPLGLDYPEFIGIYNPNHYEIDISGYAITKGVTLLFPEGTIINANDTVFVTDNVASDRWWSQQKQVIEWTDGKLSNNGERVLLENQYGIMLDYIKYEVETGWPVKGFTNNTIMTLKDPDLDNHFGENWLTEPVGKVVDSSDIDIFGKLSVYPNPTNGEITLKVYGQSNATVQIYNTFGQVLISSTIDNSGMAHIDMSYLPSGLYFAKANNDIKKLLLVK